MAKRTKKQVQRLSSVQDMVSALEEILENYRQRKRHHTLARLPIQKGQETICVIKACGKCGHTFAGGAWEPFTRASETNNRIIRRNAEGATAADMAFIAQEELEYERELAEGTTEEE